MKARLSPSEYTDGILQGDRMILSKAITLAESNLPSDQQLAQAVLKDILAHTGQSIRIGITGVPGVGKSTFIEVFGNYLTDLGKKVAVLTVDPTSQVTKGSILGDKTRMEELARNPNAFIRPSASGNALGGVAATTRECMLLCEAAGFDVIIVETVGVGQSETTVRKMVDFFLLLMLAGAGDELQGIKKGIMEMADGLVITKADGDNKKKASEARAEYLHALHLFRKDESGWTPTVQTCSAVEKEGIADVWKTIQKFQAQQTSHGHFATRREQQRVDWMHEHFDRLLALEIRQHETLHKKMKALEEQVIQQSLTAPQAASILFEEFISLGKRQNAS